MATDRMILIRIVNSANFFVSVVIQIEVLFEVALFFVARCVGFSCIAFVIVWNLLIVKVDLLRVEIRVLFWMFWRSKCLR